MYYLNMATIHISETEAARDFARIMERVYAGEEVYIESPEKPPAVVKLAAPERSYKASDIIARLKAREEERGYPLTMDDDFVADMEDIIRNRKPADHSAWD